MNLRPKEVKSRAVGSWEKVLRSICPELAEAFESPRHVRCPLPDHRDHHASFRWNSEQEVFHCTCGHYDPFEVVKKLRGVGFGQALRLVAEQLGLEPEQGNGKPVRLTDAQLLEQVARAKKCSTAGLKRYGACIQGQEVEFPCYAPNGEVIGRFRQNATGKGRFTKNSKWGCFLPHREGSPIMPEPGQSWLILEGFKDAATASDLGFNALGLPSNRMPVEWISRLTGCTVIWVPDRDEPSQAGMQESMARLEGVAGQRRIVHLPFELRESGGADLRDAIAKFGLEKVRQMMEQSVAYSTTSSKNGAALQKPPDVSIAPGEPQRRELKRTDPHIVAKVFLESAGGLVYLHQDWWQWSRGQYRLITADDFANKLYEFLNSRYTNVRKSGVADVTAQARALAGVHSSREPPFCLDKDLECKFPEPSQVIAFRDRILSIDEVLSGKEMGVEATPKLFNTAAIDCNFQTADECPRPVHWHRFLNAIIPDDTEGQNLLQEWFGYALVPGTSFQRMLWILGPPRSGKGTIGRVLTDLVGSHNITAPAFCSLSGQFGLAPWIGKRLALLSDSRFNSRDSDLVMERLLRVVGEDPIDVDRKNKDILVTRLRLKIIVLGNELPTLRDSSLALRPRLSVLQLQETFSGREDRNLEKKLASETLGIFWWGVEGLRRLLANQSFTEPKSSRQALSSFCEVLSPVKTFIEEECELSPAETIPKNNLFAAYRAWCRGQELKTPSAASFAKDLRSAYPKLEDRRLRSGDTRIRAWVGVRLRGENDSQNYLDPAPDPNTTF